MRYSDTARHNLTETFEGCRLKAYQDSKGVWTIGYGHTGGIVCAGLTCTQAQADTWLLTDITWAENEVNRHLHVTVTQNEFDALVDFTFNCGSGNFEHSSLLELVNRGDLLHAAQEFEKWDHCGGLVVAGLLRRRQAEEALFIS